MIGIGRSGSMKGRFLAGADYINSPRDAAGCSKEDGVKSTKSTGPRLKSLGTSIGRREQARRHECALPPVELNFPTRMLAIEA